MADQSYQPPQFRNIVIGSIVFIALVGLFCNLAGVIKRMGDVFIYIPAQLSLVQRVTSEKIIRIDSPTLVETMQPGKYMIYGSSFGPALANERDEILLNIRSQKSGEQIKIIRVQRGIRPYDTPFAEGRPVLEFVIPAADQYEITFEGHPNDLEYGITLVPDYTTGKELTIWVAYIFQIVILLFLLGMALYPRYRQYRARIQRIEAPQKKMQSKGQAFWDAEAQKDKNKTQK